MNSESWSDRLGVQTIIWGEEFPDGLEAALGQITRLGFKGVEFAQVPAKLGRPEEFENLMRKYSLRLLGMAGGSLYSRLEFCRHLSIKPDYLYVQKWESETALKAIDEGYTLALHPHQYARIDNVARAVSEIKRAASPRFILLPDTAHLYLASEPFLKMLTENEPLIKVVHLKDWTPEFGWSMYTYARGFTELGRGVVPLEESRQPLKQWVMQKADRWIVLEQDSTQRNVSQSLSISLQWFRDDQAGTKKLKRLPTSDYSYPPFTRSMHAKNEQTAQIDPTNHQRVLSKLNRLLLRSALDSCRNVDRLYLTILEELADLLDIHCASLWEVSTRTETARLCCFWRPSSEAKTLPTVRVINLTKSLSGLALEERSIKYFTCIQKPYEGRFFADVAFLNDLRLEGMICIPVSNYWNINQPEILINLFPRDHYEVLNARSLFASAPAPQSRPLLKPLYDEVELKPLFRVAALQVRQSVAMFVERSWEQIRSEVAQEVNWIGRQERTLDEFLSALIRPICERLECRYVEIYLLDASGLFLTLHAPITSPRTVFKVPPEDSNIGRVWKQREVMNSGVEDTFEKQGPTYLRMPIYAQAIPIGNEILGVIACTDKRSEVLEHDNFSQTDEIILDAFQAAIAPFIERMQAAKARGATMRRITHELRGPLTVLRGATKYAMKEMAERNWKFSRDYIHQARSYITLMEQIVAKAGFLRIEGGLKLHRTRVLLFEDVIVPVISGLDDYLNDRNFSKSSINVERVRDTFHALFLDKLRFQQVVFNLLSNSIKYAFENPDLFKIEVLAEELGGIIVLRFRDWGTGVPLGMEESIFREGVRGPNADDLNAAGDGLGLWLVREIIKAHGGRITVTRLMNPTEFTIALPATVKVPKFEN